MKRTVIYHRGDFDGIFCREIARKKLLRGVDFIGWDFGDEPIPFDYAVKYYVFDLPMGKPFGLEIEDEWAAGGNTNCVWIDHHKSAIDTHPKEIPGYRIDGVAACRLVWQWFTCYDLPGKEAFIDRSVCEPMAVRLAGEYDIWDKRDPDSELFQHGLRSRELTDELWDELLDMDRSRSAVVNLLNRGTAVQYAKTQENESIIKAAGFTIEFEGLKFLACNHARYNLHLFTAGLTSEHDACFGFAWRNGIWNISLYHVPGKEHHDLSKIAVKYGGGGHRGACGFTLKTLPFINNQ